MNEQGQHYTVAVSGASGFIGSELVKDLRAKGHRVIALVRKIRKKPKHEERLWNPQAEEIDEKIFEDVDVVIHLAGRNLSSGRWNAEIKEELRNSRVVSTELLSKTLAKLSKPPRLFLCASAIGFYGDRGSEILDESSKKGKGFLPDLCQDWENATKAAVRAGIRVVQLRTGIVLETKGGALQRVLSLFKMGLGGVVGAGEQYMSWISMPDYIRVIYHIIQTPSLRGPINLTAPHPVTNREWTRVLGHVLRRPALLFMPSLVVQLFLGEMGQSLVLSGSRVLPRRLLESGFHFHHSHLKEALEYVIHHEFR